jgi:hypothetical protein
VPFWADQIASLNRQVVAKHKFGIDQFDCKIVEEEVDCLTIHELTVKSKHSRFDLTVIDAEGHDGIIARQLSPDVSEMVYLEHCHLSELEKINTFENLRNKGYFLAEIDGADAFFTKDG